MGIIGNMMSPPLRPNLGKNWLQRFLILARERNISLKHSKLRKNHFKTNLLFVQLKHLESTFDIYILERTWKFRLLFWVSEQLLCLKMIFITQNISTTESLTKPPLIKLFNKLGLDFTSIFCKFSFLLIWLGRIGLVYSFL